MVPGCVYGIINPAEKIRDREREKVMGNESAVWPLFVLGGLLTAIAAGIFVAIFLAARRESQEGPP
jgi:hypothetical protein